MFIQCDVATAVALGEWWYMEQSESVLELTAVYVTLLWQANPVI